MAADTTVSGITISATDSDGDNITYSIISSAGPFKLSGDGSSVLTNGLTIDYESQDSYTLTIQAEAAGEDGKSDDVIEQFWQLTVVRQSITP